MKNKFLLYELKTIDLIFLTKEDLMALFFEKYKCEYVSKDVISVEYIPEERYLDGELRLKDTITLLVDFYYKDIKNQLIRDFTEEDLNKVRNGGINYSLYGEKVLQIFKPVIDIIIRTKITSEKGDYFIEWNPITDYNQKSFLKSFTTWANICIPHKLGKRSYDR